MKKIGINGFGRIGRLVTRVLLEKFSDKVEIVAVNDLTDSENLAYLFQYDTSYKKYPGNVSYSDGQIHVTKDGASTADMTVLSEKDPEKLPWGDLGVDTVIESTGFFRTEELASKHITAGAKRVVLSAPGKGGNIPTVVLGVNENPGSPLSSNASCTTNSVAPVIEILDRRIGFDYLWGLTVHSYTSSQVLQDGPSRKKLRDGRAAAQNMIPTTTGSAKAIFEVMPHLKGKVSMSALRVPTITGSMVYLTTTLSKDIDLEGLNTILEEEASSFRYRGIVQCNYDKLVSSDIIMSPYSSIINMDLIELNGRELKMVLWYDNEWAYANRLAEMVVG